MQASKPALLLVLPLLCCCWLGLVSPAWAADPANSAPASNLADLQSPDRTPRESVQGAIEQLRQELTPPPATPEARPESAPATSSAQEDFSTRLNLIEQTLVYQQQRGFESVQSSNRTILLVAAGFAALGLLGLLFAALILVRSLNRFSEVVMTLPVTHSGARGHLPAMHAEMHPALPDAVEQVSARFLGAIDLLEKRIQELEHVGQQTPKAIAASTDPSPSSSAVAQPERRPAAAHHPAPANTLVLDIPAHTSAAPANGGHAATSVIDPAVGGNDPAQQLSMLVGKGQALLNLGQSEDALSCFDQALALEPQHADTLVKRGTALERLQRIEEAVQSYDRAIAADPSLTVAYLHKGAACNRLQRFREALECYEKALRSEQKATVTL